MRALGEPGGGHAAAATPLPAEIAFLADHGIAPALLFEAAREARRIGVDPARQVVATGLVTEDAFYRALAASLGLRFLAAAPPILPGGDPAAPSRNGIARLKPDGHGLSFAVAPEGAALRRMQATFERGRQDIAVTTPSALAAALREANAGALAQAIAGLDQAGLERPSARTGPTDAQCALLVVLLGLLSYCCCLMPEASFVALSLAAMPIFLATVALRLTGLFEAAPVDLWTSWRWRLDESRLPAYTVAVPLLRETAVLPKLLAALAALDYPPAKLDIALLVESNDAELIAAIRASQPPPHIRMAIVPAGSPKTKPRALNLALLEARGEFLTIFDAEDVPDPQQLRAAAALFLREGAGLACVQARLVIDNGADGPLSALFALEYAGLFDVVNPGLLRSRLPIMLGGTSNHFRTAALRRIGGWDAWNVTEDADVGLRLVRAGHRFADLPSRTLEEAPRTLGVWMRQRTRWMKGYMQTLITHLANPRRLVAEAGPVASAAFVALSLGTVVSALGYPAFVAALAVVLIDGSLFARDDFAGRAMATLALSVPLTGLISLLGPALLGAWRRRAFGLLVWLPLMPLYYLLVSAAAWLAIAEYWRDPHRWNKTPHGLARTSRYTALTDA